MINTGRMGFFQIRERATELAAADAKHTWKPRVFPEAAVFGARSKHGYSNKEVVWFRQQYFAEFGRQRFLLEMKDEKSETPE